MARVRTGVASEGKGATPQEESGVDSKLELVMAKIVAMMEDKFQQMGTRVEDKLSGLDKRLKERLTRLEKPRSDGEAGVLEDTSTQRYGTSKDGVTQDTPQTGSRMLQGKEQPSSGHHKRSKIKYQRLGLAIATRRDRRPVVSPFGEGLLKTRHIRTLPSHPHICTSSNQDVIMKFMV